MQFKVRDKRNKGWFWIENEYFNGFGKILGANAIAVYVSLCRHADQDQKCFPSQEEMGKELKLSKRTIIKIIKRFQKHRIIEIQKSKDKHGKWRHNTYWLLDKTEWVYPSAIVSPGKPGANNDKIQVQPFHTNKTHKNNTHISNYKMYYKGQPMIKDYGKLYVLQKGDKILFTGKEEDIEYVN